jgi:hypothetical protein
MPARRSRPPFRSPHGTVCASPIRAYGVDPDDPGFLALLRARRLQSVLWMVAKAGRFPKEAVRAGAALDELYLDLA